MNPNFDHQPVLQSLEDLVESLMTSGLEQPVEQEDIPIVPKEQSPKGDALSQYFQNREILVNQVFQTFCLFEDATPKTDTSLKAETLLLALGHPTWCDAATRYCHRIGFKQTLDTLSKAIKSLSKQSTAQIGADCFVALFEKYTKEQQISLFEKLVSSWIDQHDSLLMLTIASQFSVVRNDSVQDCLITLFKNGTSVTKQISSMALSMLLERSTSFENLTVEYWKENIDILHQIIFCPSSPGRTIFCSAVSRFPVLFDLLLQHYPDSVQSFDSLTFLILNFSSNTSFYSAISHQSRFLIAEAIRNPTDSNLYHQIMCEVSPYLETLREYFNFPSEPKKLHVAVIDLIHSDELFKDIVTYGLHSEGFQKDYLPFIRPEKLTMILERLLQETDPACRDLGFLSVILYCTNYSELDKSLIQKQIVDNPEFFDLVISASGDDIDQAIDKLYLRLRKIFSSTEFHKIFLLGSQNSNFDASISHQLFKRFVEETNQ